jgi:hypothetical protein
MAWLMQYLEKQIYSYFIESTPWMCGKEAERRIIGNEGQPHIENLE